MLEVSLEWVWNAAQGILAAAWVMLSGLFIWLHRRVVALEEAKVEPVDFERLTNDMHTVKRVLYAIAYKLEVGPMAEALNARET